MEYPPLGPPMPMADSNLGSGLVSAAYENNGRGGSFTEALPSDLAYSPPPPDTVRTASYAGLVPASVERLGSASLGGTSLTDRVGNMYIGSNIQPPMTAPIDNNGKFPYSSAYLHPNRTAVGSTGLEHPQRSASADALKYNPKKEKFQYTPFDKRNKLNQHGIFPKETTSVVTPQENRKFEFKTPSSGPVPNTRSMDLVYSNMHTVMAARELCVGIDADIRNMEYIEHQVGWLIRKFPHFLAEFGIDKQELSVGDVNKEMDDIKALVTDALVQARSRRFNAEDMMKTEGNCRDIFGVVVPKRDVAANASASATAAGIGADDENLDIEGDGEDEVEGGGVGLGLSN